MSAPASSVDVPEVPSGNPTFRKELALRLMYRLRAVWRLVRVTRAVSRFLGPQYRRSRDLLEIDITYLCNLHCLNCNRSVAQAPEAQHMPLDMVCDFVDESIQRGKRWRRIRVLGGEPTLHPRFHEIIAELRRYLSWHSACILEVVTNGYGPRVARELARLPADVRVDNSAKTSPVQAHFAPFNLAPIDDVRYALADFANACAIARDCGMGLTPTGYYPCAVAGGIDRIVGARLGLPRLPDDVDDMVEATRRFCALCGRFRDGHRVPSRLRSKLTEARISPSWESLYESWRRDKAAARTVVALTVKGRSEIVAGENRVDDPTQTA